MKIVCLSSKHGSCSDQLPSTSILFNLFFIFVYVKLHLAQLKAVLVIVLVILSLWLTSRCIEQHHVRHLRLIHYLVPLWRLLILIKNPYVWRLSELSCQVSNNRVNRWLY